MMDILYCINWKTWQFFWFSDCISNIQELNVFEIVQQRFSKQNAAVLVMGVHW